DRNGGSQNHEPEQERESSKHESSGLSSSFVQWLSAGASRPAALLLHQIRAVFSVVAPGRPGAAPEIHCTTDEDRPLVPSPIEIILQDNRRGSRIDLLLAPA